MAGRFTYRCSNQDCKEVVLVRSRGELLLPVRTSAIIWSLPESGLVVALCFLCRAATCLGQRRRDDITTSSTLSIKGMSVTTEGLLNAMEARWQEVVKSKKKGRPELAVGLRFNVFVRDRFRCQYCGLSARDGALLHADHVIPESKGGPTTLENLITACVDCNLGKSDKDIGDALVV